jgi:acyl-CoA synthetase (NDP forming)
MAEVAQIEDGGPGSSGKPSPGRAVPAAQAERSSPSAGPGGRSLSALFAPASVAVVGASDDGRKWGNWLARGALRGQRRRLVHLVNATAPTVLGQPAHRSLVELPSPPDLVVVAVPPAAVEAVVDEALEVGARAIVVVTATNAQGAPGDIDGRLAGRVSAAGAVLLGPNCLGVFDAAQQLELVPSPLPAGTIGLISQSGNLALELAVLAGAERLGFSRFASLGNQADLDATALVRELATDPHTRLIALYLEDFRNGREFARAAGAAAQAGKPVVALAIERLEATERAVRSHTGAVASDAAAIDAAFRAAGVDRVTTPRELIDVAHARLRCHPMAGRRVAVLADGGGHASVAAAAATLAGLEVPAFSAQTSAAVASLLPPSAGVHNPVDLAGAAERDVRSFDRVASIVLGSGEVDALLTTGYLGGYAEYAEEFAREELAAIEVLGGEVAATRCAVVAQTMYAQTEAAHALRLAGVPVYATIEQTVGVLRRLAQPSAASAAAIPELPAPQAPPVAVTRGRGDGQMTVKDGYLAARAVLAGAGVPFVAQVTVASLDEAVAASDELGYPVVLKALGLALKSDLASVVPALEDRDAVAAAYLDLTGRLEPDACSVERMAPVADGVQLLVWVRWDPRFGPVVLVGRGGIDAKLLRDTVSALGPVSEARAEEMLRALEIGLLRGAPGRRPLAVDRAAAAIAILSQVAAAHPELVEFEINPLLVTTDQAIALDARWVPAA